MSQSIEVLDQRTQRDLKFVETMEVQLKNLENKFKEVESGHESNLARQYKVPPHELMICLTLPLINKYYISWKTQTTEI